MFSGNLSIRLHHVYLEHIVSAFSSCFFFLSLFPMHIYFVIRPPTHRSSMLDELDFTKEAANQEVFRKFLEDNGLEKEVTAPRVFAEASTRRVLTMVSNEPFVQFQSSLIFLKLWKLFFLGSVLSWWVPTSQPLRPFYCLVVFFQHIRVTSLTNPFFLHRRIFVCSSSCFGV